METTTYKTYPRKPEASITGAATNPGNREPAHNTVWKTEKGRIVDLKYLAQRCSCIKCALAKRLNRSIVALAGLI